MTAQVLKREAFPLGFALFSMFFGAGNIIYPLAVGHAAGDKVLYAMLGLILTAAFIPIAGFIAMILFQGDFRAFFGRLGKLPGFVLALTIISLLGPLGSTPRCIALAYATIKGAGLSLSPLLFNSAACLLIFVCCFKKKYILKILGAFLTPLLLISLFAITFLGLTTASAAHAVSASSFSLFLHGIVEGYNTMDLLAAFFFSSSMIALLQEKEDMERCPMRTAFFASMIGALLLTAVYAGFSAIASFHGNTLQLIGSEEILSKLTLKLAGPYAGFLVCVTIALACLTTAIALISAFCDFIQKECLPTISYSSILAGALLVTFVIASFEFTGISAFLFPILRVCYPSLILLTFLNIAFKLVGFKPVKTPIALLFLATIVALFY